MTLPEWLVLTLQYIGTSTIATCISVLLGRDGRHSLLMFFFWPLFLFFAPAALVHQHLRAQKRVVQKMENDGTRDESIIFWRAQLASDSPTEQMLARDVLTQHFGVPEEEPEPESVVKKEVGEHDALDYESQSGPPTEVAIPEKPLVEYCTACNGTGWRTSLNVYRTGPQGEICTRCAGKAFVKTKIAHDRMVEDAIKTINNSVMPLMMLPPAQFGNRNARQ